MRSRVILPGTPLVFTCLASLALLAACSDQELTNPTNPFGLVVTAKPDGGGPSSGLDPEVYEAIPPEAEQNTTLDVNVVGANFDDGSSVRFLLAGKPTKNIKTNSTEFVDEASLVANITVAPDAATVDYDIEVTTSRKRRGIGTEMFRVKLGKATVWAEVEMCAKTSVIDEINSINEMEDSEPWPEINSTQPACQCLDVPDFPELCASGTLTYTTAGSKFEWRFSGAGFYPFNHVYVLIYAPDPWPSRNLVCLEEEKSNRRGVLRFQGSIPLPSGISSGKIWIVRKGWVDCDGDGFWARENPEGLPRLTNDLEGDGTSDASESCLPPYGSPPWEYPCDDPGMAYDWLFGNALITYEPTGIP